jgi:prevent-host-death family protein
MRFSTDEIKPFYELRQSLSKAIDEVERDGGEVVIAKHGKPVAALLSAAGLYRYRELDRLMVQLVSESNQTNGASAASVKQVMEQLNSLPRVNKTLR